MKAQRSNVTKTRRNVTKAKAPRPPNKQAPVGPDLQSTDALIQIDEFNTWAAIAAVTDKEINIDWEYEDQPHRLRAVRVPDATSLYRGKVVLGRSALPRIAEGGPGDAGGDFEGIRLDGKPTGVVSGTWILPNRDKILLWFDVPRKAAQTDIAFLDDLQTIKGNATLGVQSLSLSFTFDESRYVFKGVAKDENDEYEGRLKAYREAWGIMRGRLVRSGPSVQFFGKWTTPDGVLALRARFPKINVASMV